MSNNNQKNFYQGQNVLAKDLNDLQAYSDKNRNILVSDLLGSGILNGFEVTHKTDLAFSVSPGVAFDGNGNRLILEESTDVDLTKHVSTNGKSEPIKIRIKHSYIGSEPKKDSQDIETLTILTPSVEFITDETIKENLFQIATITLNEHADPLITRGEIFIALPDLTNTVATNKTEIDSKVDDNTSAIATTNTAVEKNKTELDSILSKGSDGSANLSGHIVSIVSPTEIKLTSPVWNYIKVTGTGFLINDNHGGNKGEPFNFISRGKLGIYSYNDLNGVPQNIDLVAGDSKANVTINGSPIIETSSVPDRGSYTKFYDGTMICNLDTTDISKGTKWNFPATFTTEPIIIGFQYEVFQESSSFWETGYNISSITESTLKTSFTETGGSAYAVRLKISVMGRWKAFPKTTQ